ncbi:hypothetical protein EDB19DRAFT_194528 [Suillus lakei]|nr:hypothetical protein EDB19DRAFT_194528 [Suillus lakei]
MWPFCKRLTLMYVKSTNGSLVTLAVGSCQMGNFDSLWTSDLETANSAIDIVTIVDSTALTVDCPKGQVACVLQATPGRESVLCEVVSQSFDLMIIILIFPWYQKGHVTTGISKMPTILRMFRAFRMLFISSGKEYIPRTHASSKIYDIVPYQRLEELS